MRAFRIILALIIAGATFYSLNTVAMQYGYPDRLDFRNHHYHGNDCGQRHFRNHGYRHHDTQLPERGAVKIDSLPQSK